MKKEKAEKQKETERKERRKTIGTEKRKCKKIKGRGRTK